MIKGWVYFMRPIGMVGPIKIGCSYNIDSRLSQISTWSPYPLEIAYFEKGDGDLERNIHACFADYHSHREWFHPGERLLAAVERLRAGETIRQVIDLNDKKGKILGGKRGPRPENEVMKGYRSYQAKLRWARKRASKEAGEEMWAPEWVWEAMSKWDGQWVNCVRTKPVRPTEEQFEKFDRIIESPVKYMLTRAQKFPKARAA